MAGGKGNIDAISVSLGADLGQLRKDLRAAKSELDKALPQTRNVHVSVSVNTPKNAVSDLYQSIQGQFQEFQKNNGQALRIAPRMTVDPRVMRDFRRDLERNMMQAGRSGQAVRVPIKFNGDIKAFIASIGHVEVPVYGKWAGWSPGGGPPEGAGGGGGGGAPHGPRGVPGRGPGGRSGPAGGGPAPEPARGRPATGTQARGATGGTVVPPHTYAGSGGRRDDASSDQYQVQGAPTPRQQRQATRRAAMSGATPPPARRPGLSVPARGDPTRPSDRPYEAPPGGRVDMASVRGGSAEVELQGEERAAYISQQAETRSRRNFAPNTAPQVRSGGRPTTPRAIERLERRRRYQASVQRGMSPQDAAAREHVRSGFHTLDPDLAAAYDIINDPESTLSFDQFLEAAERTREAYGTAFHGGLTVTPKGIRRTGQAKRVAKQRRQARGFAGGAGDLTGIPPEVILFDAALDAARDLQKRQTDPNYAIQTGDQKRRGRSGKPGQIGGRNAGRVASETVDPSRVSEILARRAVGGPGNGWETLKKEGYTAAEVSVAKSRIGANNPKVVSNKDPRAPGLANVTLDEETLEGGVRTRHFTHIGPEAPALPAAGGQGMFRTEPTPDRPQPRDLDRPGIDPASLIGGGQSDLGRYSGRGKASRGPFGSFMDRRADLARQRNQNPLFYRFAEGGQRPKYGKFIDMDFPKVGAIPGTILRQAFGQAVPRKGSKERAEVDQRFRTGMRNLKEREKKPAHQQGGKSGGPEWQRNRALLIERERANGLRCAYCGQPTVEGDNGPRGTTVDHIEDVGSTGVPNHSLDNLQIMDNQHNGLKAGGKSARKLAEGGGVKWSGLASSRAGIKSATMVGERGPEIMVEGHNGKAEVIPSHKIAGFMDGMAEGGLQFRQTGGGMPGISFRGAAGRYTTAGAAAGAATAAGIASSMSSGIIRVFVTNWPTGFAGGGGGGAAGAAHGAPAGAHAAAPGAPPAAGAPPAPGPGAVPGAPPTGAGRVRRGGIDPLARVRAQEIARGGEDREGSEANRATGLRFLAQQVAQNIPVRAVSVSTGQLFQQSRLGGRAQIQERQRRADVARQRYERSLGNLTNLRQTGAETRFAISDITSGRRAFDSTADRDATLADLRSQYGQNVQARREQRQVVAQRGQLAEERQAGVLTRGQQLRSQAVGVGGIIAGTAIFSTAMAAFSTAAQAAAVVLDPLVQTMLGWPAAIDKVTSSIRDSIQAAGGNVRAGVAAAVAPSGVSAGFVDAAGANLTRTGTYRAAATAGASAEEITRASMGRPRGLFTGTGGLFGTNIATELFGGQPGFMETVAGRLGAGGGARTHRGVINPATGKLDPEALEQARKRTTLSQIFDSGIDKGLQEKTVTDLNKNLQAAAEYAGDVASGFELLTGATDDQKEAMVKSATNEEERRSAQTLADTGVAVVGPNRANLRTGQFAQYAEQQARGQLIQDPELLLRAREPQRRAQAFAISANAAFRSQEDTPAQFGLQQLTRPLGRIGAGYDTSNLSAQARKDQADSAKSQKSIAESTQKGVAAMENIVARIDRPSLEGGLGPGGPAAGPTAGRGQGPVGPALTQFRSLVGQIGGLGTQIQDRVDTVAQEQATLQAHEYAEQIRLSTRSLGDAKDLWAAINGNSSKTVGGLQGQNILLDRQNQLLGRRQQRLAFKSEDIGFKMSDLQIQSQNLGFQQSQRQINFNKAVAGFAAPGSTPEERAARINEAKLEADFAQKQLDLQIAIAEQGRQQLKIAKEQAGISRQQFGNQVQQQDNQYAITREEAKRAVTDIQNALALLQEGHTVTIDTASAEEAIANLQKEQGLLVEQAENYLTHGQEVRSQVLSDVTDLMAATGRGFNELVGNVQTAWSRAFTSAYRNFLLPLNQALNTLGQGGQLSSRGGPASLPNNREADGIIGTTAGATQFLAGEAGREHVVVLRNATEGTLMGLGGKGGGGGVNVGGVTIVVSGTKEMDEAKLAEMVVERMARKLAMLGV